MSDISKKTFWILIIGLVLARVIMLALFINNIPPTDIQPDWRPNFGGSYWPDEVVFFNLGKSLADFKPAESVIYIGYSMFLAPFIFFTGAANPAMIAKPIALVQGIFLFSLSIILVALVGLRFFKNRKLALISASIFLVYPYLVYGIWKIIGHKNAIPTFQYQMWTVILSDYLSAFLIFLTIWIFLKLIERFNLRKNPLVWAGFLGAAAGAAGLVRPPNLALAAFIFLFLAYYKKIKEILVFSTAAIIVYLPQFIYNAYFFKWPWVFGDVVLPAGLPQSGKSLSGMFTISNLWLNFRHFSSQYYFLFFLLLIAILSALVYFGVRHLKNTDRKLALIFSFWFLFFVLFYGMFEGSYSQLRYFLPAIPPAIYFFMSIMLYIFKKKGNNNV